MNTTWILALGMTVFFAGACSSNSAGPGANDAGAAGSGGISTAGGATATGGASGGATSTAGQGGTMQAGGTSSGGDARGGAAGAGPGGSAGADGVGQGGAGQGGAGRGGVAGGGASGTSGNTDAGAADGGAGTGGSGRDAGIDSPSPDARVDASRDAAGGGGAGGSGGAGAGGAGGSPTLPATTMWIAGDSTVMTYAAGNTQGNNGTELEGWGQEIGQFFSSKVTINNQAIGGRSVAMFMWTVATDSAGNQLCVDSQGTPKFKLDSAGNKIDAPQWSRIKAGIKTGDFLLVQFGHNDETTTCPRHVATTDYETYLGIMADAVIAKGATPIFVTPMGHRTFTGTKFNNTLLPYANAMKDEASKKKLEVEDLNLRSGEYYESVGTTYLASKIFDGGTTHFIKAGAVKMAELIIGEIKKNEGPLAAYLK